jgi:hypothetical protein
MKLDAIKAQIAELPAEEKTALSAWLTEQGMDAWDKQMQADFSPGGKGMGLVEKVREDICSGKFQPMERGRPLGDPAHRLSTSNLENHSMLAGLLRRGQHLQTRIILRPLQLSIKTQ